LILIPNLTGNKISLISKKNIRYEGTLYSINESEATVALQNVKSFGTEGRESDPGTTFVAPQDAVHAYLLFRGCDIKDLHVHEAAAAEQAAAAAKAAANKSVRGPNKGNANPAASTSESAAARSHKQDGSDDVFEQKENQSQQRPPKPPQGGRGGEGSGRGGESGGRGGNRRPRKPQVPHQNQNQNSHPQVGTGASLLNRKARGSVADGGKSLRCCLCRFLKGCGGGVVNYRQTC
jgi:protein LSM14